MGRIVYKRHFGVLEPEGKHGAISLTITFVGTLPAMLVVEG